VHDFFDELRDSGFFERFKQVVFYGASMGGYAAVAAAKVALESVSRSIAVEMAHLGIRSNIVQAGVTDTPSLRMIPGSEQLLNNARERNPQGRLTQAEDVANVVYLLSTEEASWITGTVIKVDGGESLR